MLAEVDDQVTGGSGLDWLVAPDPGGPAPAPLRVGPALTRSALEAMRAEGLVVRVVGDVYLPTPLAGWAAARAEALRSAMPREATVCLLAAAWVHGVDVDPEPVDVVVSRAGARWRMPDWVRERERSVSPADVVVVHGVSVTTRCRTAADVARSCPRSVARPVVAALLATGVAVDDVLASIDRERRWPGANRARALLRELAGP